MMSNHLNGQTVIFCKLRKYFSVKKSGDLKNLFDSRKKEKFFFLNKKIFPKTEKVVKL